MTLLHITAPGVAGGLESVVLELVSGLSKAGHRVALTAVLDQGVEDQPLITRAAARGVDVCRLVVPPRAYLREFRELRTIINECRPDIVHTHGYRADLIGGLAARLGGLPWVSTMHGFTGGDWKNRLYEWLQVRAYRGARAVVAVSRPIRIRLIDGGAIKNRVHLIPNAWAPSVLLPRDEARRRLGISGPEPVIGWVGRLTKEKGADVFIEALAMIQDRPWRASIIGEGREHLALEAQAVRLGIGRRIHWHGLVPDAAALYRAFDAWVLSSRTEGTPIALFEAMAARVPVVVTAVGGVPDIVSSDEALLVRPGDPTAMAGAIAAVLGGGDGSVARAVAAFGRLSAERDSASWLDAHLTLYHSLQSSGA